MKERHPSEYLQIDSQWRHTTGVTITICSFQEDGESWRIVSKFGDGGLITYPSAYFIYDWVCESQAIK